MMKRKTTPAYIFDEHNEAFYFWHKAKYDGLIDKPLDLFHVDAHHDMCKAGIFKKSIYFSDNSAQNGYVNYYKDFAKNELSINNFILPAILSGIIKNVYFIYPDWRNLRPLTKRLNICSAFGEGRILKYGLRLNKKHNLKIFQAFPDLKYFNFSTHEISKIPANRKVILDIDLDYFACIDSILNHMRYELEITKEQFCKRKHFLANRTLPFFGLEFDFIKRNGKYYTQVAHKKAKEIAYLPSRKEIASEIDALMGTLQNRKIQPVLVTICRSIISGYCPRDYSKFIETKLKKKLISLLK